MSAFKRGDAFFGGAAHHGKDHLWVIINDPETHSDIALYVNITKMKGTALDDTTCIIHRGDHPFIVEPSCIRYDGARTATCSAIQNALQAGALRPAPPASPELVERIRSGAAATTKWNAAKKSLL